MLAARGASAPWPKAVLQAQVEMEPALAGPPPVPVTPGPIPPVPTLTTIRPPLPEVTTVPVNPPLPTGPVRTHSPAWQAWLAGQTTPWQLSLHAPATQIVAGGLQLCFSHPAS